MMQCIEINGLTQKETRSLMDPCVHWTLLYLIVFMHRTMTELEAVVRGCSVKMVFLEISQDSQENTCARDSDLINFIKKESLAQVFSSEFCEIFRNTFLQNTSGGCFWRVSSSQQKLRLPFLQELGSPCWIYFCITSFLFYFSFFSSSIPFFYFYVIFPIYCKSQLCPCDFDKLNSFNLGKRNYLPQCFSVGFAYENLFVD